MKYLPVPFARNARKVKLRIFADGKMVQSLDVRFAWENPEWVYTYPLPEKECTFTVDGVPYAPELTDKQTFAPDAERPAIHFTPADGWQNDPNGCYFDGKLYHMFYQSNPVDPGWGNMHWGHAVSSDLLRWEHRPLTLAPDEFGTMFSGSAIVDRENASGLGNGTIPPVLLFYTAAGGACEQAAGKRFCQCMAYSTDGGETFVKYAQNPVIPHIVGENRDPKVFPAGDGTFVCALYLDQNNYALFTSADLLKWTMTQQIRLPGDGECPDLFPLPYAGGMKWVFMGASRFYYTGDLRNGIFFPDTEQPLRFGIDNADDSYASQTFYSDDGIRRRIAWSRWQYAGDAGLSYQCSMTMPVILSLAEIDGTLRLCADWIDTGALPTVGAPVADGVYPLTLPCRFPLRMAAGKADLTVMGVPVGFDGRTLRFAGNEYTLPCEPGDVEILADRFSLELRCCGGAMLIARSVPADADPALRIKI